MRLVALLAECCLQAEKLPEKEEHGEPCLKLLKERLEKIVGDIGAFLLNVASRTDQLIVSKHWNEDPAVKRAVDLFSVSAWIYINDFVKEGREAEKIILAWYLSGGERLSVSRKVLEYVLLHHVVDLVAEYITREQPGDNTALRVLERARGNRALNEVVQKLDLLIIGVEASGQGYKQPSELFNQLIAECKKRAREIYGVLVYDRARKGMRPGSKAFTEEIIELIEWLLFLRGLKGMIVVNGELLNMLGAVERAASLLRRRREVRLEFYSKGVKEEDMKSRKAEPALVIVARNAEELKSKLCAETSSANIWLPPDTSKLRTICGHT